MITEADVTRVRLIEDLKKYFYSQCGVTNEYERSKIWAHWIIYHQCAAPQPDDFVPSVGLLENQQLVDHLVSNKGVPRDRALLFRQNLADRACAIAKRLRDARGSRVVGLARVSQYQLRQGAIVKVAYEAHAPQATAGTIQHLIPKATYDKLQRQYVGPSREFEYRLWKMLCNYHLLDGAGFQWGLSPNAFQTLQSELDIKTELFASPINSSLPRYFSMFREDQHFGSLGNLFHSGSAQFAEGCYQVNPPFLEIVFSSAAQLMIRSLAAAKEAGRQLAFVYFMPNWSDCPAYDLLNTSEFKRDQCLIPKFKHYYYDSSRKSAIKVNFDTHMMLLTSLPLAPGPPDGPEPATATPPAPGPLARWDAVKGQLVAEFERAEAPAKSLPA